MKKTTMFNKMVILVMAFLLLFFLGQRTLADELPVLVPDLPEREGFIRNPITFDDLHNISQSGDRKRLYVDLRNPDLQGKIHTGPYPFEAGETDYDYARFRSSNPLKNGAGLLQIEKFFS
ncbi:MAG: hypothetical protein JSU83_03305, partial [Deltaproteobacteria bacterium]